MNNVNKTLYIPLYGKAYVSKKNLFLKDNKAIEIWEKEQFELKRKSKSKWLAYYMGIRSKVFDDFVINQVKETNNTIVIHLGCGMDSRINRVNIKDILWYDIDFEEVIEERKKYYQETSNYKMIKSDVRNKQWLTNIPNDKNTIIIMEGISMYLTNIELKQLFNNINSHFNNVSILMDCYSNFAAKMSKYKNPINDVNVTQVYGLDNPNLLNTNNLKFIQEHTMIPSIYINELKGFEKSIFKKLYAGKMSKKLYKLYEFKK